MSQAVAAAADTAATATKGPPLGSLPHTFRLLVLLLLHSLLVLVCLVVLPAHLLWRQVVKVHTATASGEAEALAGRQFSPSTYDALAADSTLSAGSAARNILVAFDIFFSVLKSDTLAGEWVRRGARSSLIALFVSQAWFLSRYKGWHDEGEAMEHGDRDEVLKRRRITMGKQLESVTLTTFNVPFITVASYAIVVLCGAPFAKKPMDTLILATYFTLLIAMPANHVLGSNESYWRETFSWQTEGAKSARLRVVRQTTVCTLLGFLVGAVCILLDWEKAWQTYPYPPVIGACLGAVLGNFVAGWTYIFTSGRQTERQVERKAPSSLSKSKNSKKKRK